MKNYLLLTVFSLLVLIPGIANLPVIDRDEAHFAQASRQMLQTGNYFQIRFQNKTRFQKPPGINWLQAASVKLLSNVNTNSIWPYRVPSVLGALFSVLLTYFFSRRFIDEKIARLGAGLLASTLLLAIETHMAVIDTSLLSSILLMQGALWVIYKEESNKPPHWGWALCFWLGMTYGLVLKGVTPLIGILSITSLCLIERRCVWLRGLRPMSGFTCLILFSLACVLMVNYAEHSNYLMQMIQKDLLPKLKGGHESHGKPPLFHLAILPLTFWPASLFLWQGGSYAYRYRYEKNIRFLLAWILPTWIFFESMPTKLPQYILPTFPAIALLCALAITEWDQAGRPSRWLRSLQLLWGLLSIGLALFLASLPYLLMHQWTLVSLLLFSEITLFTLLAIHFTRQGFYQRACATILLMALLSYPLVFTTLLPRLKPLWLTATLSKSVDKNNLSKDKPLLVAGFEEPSLVFYFNTETIEFTNAITAEKMIGSAPSRLAIVESHLFTNWQYDPLKLSILGCVKGFNYSKGLWVELLIIQQRDGAN